MKGSASKKNTSGINNFNKAWSMQNMPHPSMLKSVTNIPQFYKDQVFFKRGDLYYVDEKCSEVLRDEIIINNIERRRKLRMKIMFFHRFIIKRKEKKLKAKLKNKYPIGATFCYNTNYGGKLKMRIGEIIVKSSSTVYGVIKFNISLRPLEGSDNRYEIERCRVDQRELREKKLKRILK